MKSCFQPVGFFEGRQAGKVLGEVTGDSSAHLRLAHRYFLVAASALAFGLVVASCSSSEGSTATNSGAGGSSSQGAAGGSAAASGFGGEQGDSGTILMDGSPSDGSLTEASACAADTVSAEPIPVDLHIMLDQSGSMKSSDKWGSVITALKTFFSSPDSAGIGVSLGYFPVPWSSSPPYQCIKNEDCGPYGPCSDPGQGFCIGIHKDGGSCDWHDYQKPEVPLDYLPGYESTLTASLDSHAPGKGATATEPALHGVMDYAMKWAASHPDHLTYVVFATDGEPTGCNATQGIDGAAEVAKQGLGADPPVETFVIGVGGSLGSLNKIAAAGGTDKAYLVDTGSNATQDFIKVLNEVRALGDCKYKIPVPEAGTPDYERVNVSYDDSSGKSEQLKYVSDASGCDPQDGGWYYDDPNDPKMIILCEQSCDSIQSSGAKVHILLGCETITK